MVRAYSWLTLMWGVVFLVRVAVQWVLYRADEVELLGTASLLLGLPVTAVEVVVTLWEVSRLHRHRADGERPADPPQSDWEASRTCCSCSSTSARASNS